MPRLHWDKPKPRHQSSHQTGFTYRELTKIIYFSSTKLVPSIWIKTFFQFPNLHLSSHNLPKMQQGGLLWPKSNFYATQLCNNSLNQNQFQNSILKSPHQLILAANFKCKQSSLTKTGIRRNKTAKPKQK